MAIRRVGALLATALLASVLAGPAQASTKTVFVGPPTKVKGAPKGFDPNLFLRHTTTIHAGDSVKFAFRGFHTVTFLPKGKSVPFVIANTNAPVSGVNDAAGQPFVFNGQPSLVINPLAIAPTKAKTYGGTGYRNSGLPLGPSKPYLLKFTKAGTYELHCLVHPHMHGKVRVVSKAHTVPTVAADRKVAAAELASAVAAAKKQAPAPTAGPTITAGHDSSRWSTYAFFPDKIAAVVGQPVNVVMSAHSDEVHTFSFGPDAYIKPIEDAIISDAGVLNPQIFYPSDMPGPTFPPVTPTVHGNGFLNTGIFDDDPASPNPTGGKIVFAAQGTYVFHCLVHPEMTGTVFVSPAPA
jgi:plastocyanin